MADYVIIYDTATGRLKAKLAETEQLTDALITSAKIGSGQIGSLHVKPAAIISSLIASGAIGRDHIKHGEIVSALIAAAAIGSGHIEVGAIGDALLKDDGIVSGKIAGRALQSGAYGLESITESELVSGISIDIAEYLKEPTYTSKAAISGASCVYLASGKLIDTALPHSGYLPAIGIIGDAVAADTLTPVFYGGRFSHGLLSGTCSGYWGKRVFLAASGQISRTPPSASGQAVQAIGEIADNDSLFVFPEPRFIEIAQ